MSEEIPWSKLFEYRVQIHRRYPEIWDLKIVRKRLPFILKYLKDGESVLEIGAYNRELGGRIKKYYPLILYKSLDIDPSYQHDYTSLEEVKEGFDMVLLFEVIEHLDLDGGREMVKNIYRVLKPGGRMILTTPNVYKPGHYWDITHLTPYNYKDLGGVLLSQQFELVEICRLYNAPFIQFVIKTFLLLPIFRFLGIDFTKSILVVARKT